MAERDVENSDANEGDEESEIPVKQKVAIVMVALGEEASGEVTKHLSDFEIEEITQSIAGLKNIGVDVMDKILEEFETHLMAGEWIGQGGFDFARQALERNLMFVFDDISKLTDREIQTLMREVDQKDLVVALKSASEELKDKILGNMSERVRTFITGELEFQGPMRLSEVEEVQRIVQQVRQLEEQGQVSIVRGDSDDQFV